MLNQIVGKKKSLNIKNSGEAQGTVWRIGQRQSNTKGLKESKSKQIIKVSNVKDIYRDMEKQEDQW